MDVTGFLPRITVRDGRAIEQALAGQTLFQPGVELGGAVVEASYACDDPPLLRRLADRGVPRLIDPQTLRFATDAYLEIDAIAQLPYAPSEPFSPVSLCGDAADELVAGVLEFEDRHGATDYLSPAIPVFDQELEQWIEASERVLRAAVRANGTGGRPRQASETPKGSRWHYLRPLKTTLPSGVVAKILAERGLRSHFVCELACCNWRDQDGLGGRCREHYLRVRQDEVARIELRPTSAMRLSDLHDDFVHARELAIVVSRTFRARGEESPNFDHLGRWLAVIATLTEIYAAA